MVKPPVRTKSIGTKVSDEEYAQLEKLAQEHGQTLGEWCRDVMLERAEGRKPSVIEETVLAEMLALRTILLNACPGRQADRGRNAGDHRAG